MEFTPFPKMARLNRECVVTEKIDGTNASVMIVEGAELSAADGFGASRSFTAGVGHYLMFAGSRNRWIVPGDDNYGFAAWVKANAEELMKLGPGHHFGEWWGQGINRGYGLSEKRFSLFNVERWADPLVRPACCVVVPVLYVGPFESLAFNTAIGLLLDEGSFAAPGFMNPEGIVVYHTAANLSLKATIRGDEKGKEAEAHAKKERPAKPKGNPR